MLLDDYPFAAAVREDGGPCTAYDVRQVARIQVRDLVSRRHHRGVAGEDVDVHRRPFPFWISHVAADVLPEGLDLLLKCSTGCGGAPGIGGDHRSFGGVETHESLDHVGLREIVSVGHEVFQGIGYRGTFACGQCIR